MSGAGRARAGHAVRMSAIVLGAGASGLLHALSLRAHGVDVSAVYDPDVSRARSLAELVGARATLSLDALDDCEDEVVAICGPPTVHAAQARRFARAGRLLLVEKPIALDESELATLERLDGCVPSLQWRFGRALRAIRRAIGAGELGPQPTVSIDLTWRRTDEYFSAGRGTYADWGCGALLSVGIHAIDAVLFALGGSVRSVQGAFGGRPGVEVETQAAAVLTMDSGALVTLRLTLDAANDVTRISFAGGGVTAAIIGSEEDPTASAIEWEAADAGALRRLRALERAEPGFTSGPLLVPLVGAAIRPDRAPFPAPSVRSTAAAHRTIFSLYGSLRSRAEIDRALPSPSAQSVSRACGFLDGPAPPGRRRAPARAPR